MLSRTKISKTKFQKKAECFAPGHESKLHILNYKANKMNKKKVDKKNEEDGKENDIKKEKRMRRCKMQILSHSEKVSCFS